MAFPRGDPADSAYVVRSGRLDVVVERPTRSSSASSSAALRSASSGCCAAAYAARRARLPRQRTDHLSRKRFESLLRETPEFALGLIHLDGRPHRSQPRARSNRNAAEHDRGHRARRARPGNEIAAELAAELERYGSVHQIRPEPEQPLVVVGDARTIEADNDRVSWWAARWAIAGRLLREGRRRPARRHDRGPLPLVARASGRAARLRADLARSPVPDSTIAALAPREVHVMRGATARADAIAVTARRLAAER